MSSACNVMFSNCVTYLSTMMIPTVSCVVMVTGLFGYRVVFQPLPAKLNSTLLHHAVVGPPCILDLLECQALVTAVVDDCMMADVVHFVRNH